MGGPKQKGIVQYCMSSRGYLSPPMGILKVMTVDSDFDF